MTRKIAAILFGALLILGFAGVAKAGSAYTVGDVFLGVANVGVEEFTPTGTLVQTINGGALSGFVTGMAFQNNGNLLVTDFSSGSVVQYDNSGNLLNATFNTVAVGSPESIAIDSAGNVYVSSVGGAGITKYTSAGGAAISTSIAGTRTDWIDLAADQHTMLYTDEGGTTHSVNVATNTLNPNFSTAAGDFALRIIPSGAFAGDVLVANSGDAVLLDSSGTIINTYSLPGNGGGDFALNLDPNGTDFWTSDFVTGEVWEVNIATGAIDNSWSSGASGDTLFGLVVFGQITASGGGGGGTTPEPGSICLLLTGLAGAALKRLRR
jgi:hypothetical protein